MTELLLALALAAEPSRPLHPPKVAPHPELPRPELYDSDRDGLDDLLQAALAAARPEQPMRVEYVFKRPVTQRQLDAFVHSGGTLKWVFQAVSHGFWGEIPARELRHSMEAVGRESLLLVVGDAAMEHDLDKATRNARARGVWKPGFAGSDAGFNGSPNTTIAVVDTGIDPTHADLAGRMAYWKDFEGTELTPSDDDGHGTCVSSVAFGSGAAFEATKPVLKISRPVSLLNFSPGAFPGRAPLTYGTGQITLDLIGWFDSPDPAKVNVSAADVPTGSTRSYSTVGSQVGYSPIALTYAFTPTPDFVYSNGIPQNDAGTITWEVVSTSANPYPVVPDGLPSFRGMAPGCQWAVAHAADDVMSVETALDDLMTQRQAISLKVVNLSQSPDTDGGVTLLPPKMTTLSQGGVLIVKSAGNNGRSAVNPFITASGRTALILTVGATSAINQLTQYTSEGVVAINVNEDMKPDLLAPGGSLLAVDMLCADSNSADKPDGGVPDQVPDDYVPEEGTSFSTPITAGAAALVIQALESRGYNWDWNSADGPKKVKAVLMATATETNQTREFGPSGDPVLGRSAAQKDLNEGYGVLNVDAALEAVTIDLALPFSDYTDGGSYDRRAWGRRVELTQGTDFGVGLQLAPPADYDLYLYSGAPDVNGDPVLLASADTAVYGGIEVLHYTPAVTETGMLVVKLINGHGQFTLGPPPSCGNGVKEAGEACDDNKGCCTAQCTFETDQTVCPTGLCVSGLCRAPICGDTVVNAPETCDDGNASSGDCCSSSCQKESDGSFCTGGKCADGKCVPSSGAGGGAGGGGSGGGGMAKKGCGCSAGEGGFALIALLVSRRARRRVV